MVTDKDISVEDFDFSTVYGGSQGAAIEKMGTNRFLITQGCHPKTQRRNNVQFRLRNAKGNSLQIQTRYGVGPYFLSWSHDRNVWTPAKWSKGEGDDEGDYFEFPEFRKDLVHVGVTMPLVYEDLLSMLTEWQKSPCLTIRTIGKSIEGRDLLRLEITSPKKEIPRKKRRVHYVTNQHGAEHNARWRIAGMIHWLLSEDAAEARERNIFHFAVMMNPDGPANGWPRTNAEGVDMNRTYCVNGSGQNDQTHEGYVYQKDLEDMMDSDEPVTSMWNMHNCMGGLWVKIFPGPEMGGILPSSEEFSQIVEKNDREGRQYYVDDDLVWGSYEKLKGGRGVIVGNNDKSYFCRWAEGPHEQFGITSALCEGGATFKSVEENMAGGRVLIRSIAQYYQVTRP